MFFFKFIYRRCKRHFNAVTMVLTDPLNKRELDYRWNICQQQVLQQNWLPRVNI